MSPLISLQSLSEISPSFYPTWLHRPPDFFFLVYYLFCFIISPTRLKFPTPHLPHLDPSAQHSSLLCSPITLGPYPITSHPYIGYFSDYILSPDVGSWPNTSIVLFLPQLLLKPLRSFPFMHRSGESLQRCLNKETKTVHNSPDMDSHLFIFTCNELNKLKDKALMPSNFIWGTDESLSQAALESFWRFFCEVWWPVYQSIIVLGGEFGLLRDNCWVKPANSSCSFYSI